MAVCFCVLWNRGKGRQQVLLSLHNGSENPNSLSVGSPRIPSERLRREERSPIRSEAMDAPDDLCVTPGSQWGERTLAMAAGIIDHCRSGQARLTLHGTPPQWTLSL